MIVSQHANTLHTLKAVTEYLIKKMNDYSALNPIATHPDVAFNVRSKLPQLQPHPLTLTPVNLNYFNYE